MATKSELETENAELLARNAELENQVAEFRNTLEERDADLAETKEKLVEALGNPPEQGQDTSALEARIAELEAENGRLSALNTDLELNAPEENAPQESADLEELKAQVELLETDKLSLEVQRNEYRDKAIALQVRLDEKESLHGLIDNLPPVV